MVHVDRQEHPYSGTDGAADGAGAICPAATAEKIDQLLVERLLSSEQGRAVEAGADVGVGYLVGLELAGQERAQHLAQQQFVGAQACQQRRVT